MIDMFDLVSKNCERISYNINEAKAKYNIHDEIKLMAVTKTVPAELVNHAVDCGIHLLGENRVQEYLTKLEKYTKAPEIHFIGGLQNNKVKYIIDKVSMIHSVGSLKLAGEIDKHAQKHNLIMDVLAQVNIGGEPSKGGVLTDELMRFIDALNTYKNIRLRGLMSIPPICAADDERYFAEMNELYCKIKSSGKNEFNVLSMGMSNDYLSAIKNGANIVRLGTAIFGKR